MFRHDPKDWETGINHNLTTGTQSKHGHHWRIIWFERWLTSG